MLQDSKLTVEHILPQEVKSGSSWEKDFQDEAERKEWTHKLGNLALLSSKSNSLASNLDFKAKQAKIFNNHGVSAVTRCKCT